MHKTIFTRGAQKRLFIVKPVLHFATFATAIAFSLFPPHAREFHVATTELFHLLIIATMIQEQVKQAKICRYGAHIRNKNGIASSRIVIIIQKEKQNIRAYVHQCSYFYCYLHNLLFILV